MWGCISLNLKEILKTWIPQSKLHLIPRSFDIIGSREGAIAIIEIPPEIEEYKYRIAEAIVRVHKNVRTVLRKKSPRYSAYRIRSFELLYGDRCTEVVHKEYGYLLKLDPTKVYFSPRDAYERMRIARQVREGEFVMLMFAGVGPYALAILKFQPNIERIIAVEVSPIAFKYLIENIVMNKAIGKVLAVLGDVKEVCNMWYGKCDRVIMPLPKGAYKYLDIAMLCLKPEGGIIHFYYWSREEDLFSKAEKLLVEVGKKYGFELKILERRKVSPYAPRTYKIVVDALFFH